MVLLLFLTLAAAILESGSGIYQYQNETNAYLDESVERWNAYKVEYGKTYDFIEDARHRRRFEAVVKMIDAHNERYRNGLASFTMAVNRFADMDYYVPLEDYKFEAPGESALPPQAKHVGMDEEVDWRERGAVGAVRDQLCGGACICGSCWAQAAIGALEGHHALKTGRLVELSVQQLIDCAGPQYGNYGCIGGNPLMALNYVMFNGIATEEAYPYTGEEGKCRYSANDAAARIDAVRIINGDEDEIVRIVSTVGPVAAAIHYGLESFAYYSKGVYFDPACRTGGLDHAVVITGVGEDPEFGPFYWIKNSFGPAWGEDGFLRLARGSNACGIANEACYVMPEREASSTSSSTSSSFSSTSSSTSSSIPSSFSLLYLLALVLFHCSRG